MNQKEKLKIKNTVTELHQAVDRLISLDMAEDRACGARRVSLKSFQTEK